MSRRLYIVAYDIRCPKRWRRVFKLMKRRGEHHQLSLFLVRAETHRIRHLAARLEALIDPEADAVLIAPLDERGANPLMSLGASASLPVPEIVVI